MPVSHRVIQINGSPMTGKCKKIPNRMSLEDRHRMQAAIQLIFETLPSNIALL